MGEQFGRFAEQPGEKRRVAAKEQDLVDPIAAMGLNEIDVVPFRLEIHIAQLSNARRCLDLKCFRLAGKMRQKHPGAQGKRIGLRREIANLLRREFDRYGHIGAVARMNRVSVHASAGLVIASPGFSSRQIRWPQRGRRPWSAEHRWREPDRFSSRATGYSVACGASQGVERQSYDPGSNVVPSSSQRSVTCVPTSPKACFR
ncbi:hypothetical protein D9M70_439110 [compost metagenome]